MKQLILWMALIALLIPASFAFAQEDSGARRLHDPYQNIVVDPCPTYTACSMYRDSPTFGTVMDACKSGSCLDCGETTRRCILVDYSAQCECSDVAVPGAAP